jgi:hypothetical protein
MAEPADALMLQFLTFIAEGKRSYGEAMEAWRTSCPRLSIWEDALIEGFVEVRRAEGATREQARVMLTAQGLARLAREAVETLPPKVIAA